MSHKLDIVGLYLGDYMQSLSGREIARRIAVSPQTALTALHSLVQSKILRTSVKGRNKEYTLNFDELSVRVFVTLAEHYRSLQILENKGLAIILEGLLPHAEAIILFGSFASGREKEDSDIDLIVVGKANKDKIGALCKTYPREINIEYVSLKQLGQSLKSRKPLAREILKNHALFGNADAVVQVFVDYYLQEL